MVVLQLDLLPNGIGFRWLVFLRLPIRRALIRAIVVGGLLLSLFRRDTNGSFQSVAISQAVLN